MLRGRRDRYHRLGFLIPFTVAAIATPIQMLVGDELARWVYNNEPTKFAAIELVPKTVERRARDAVRAPNADGTGERRDPDPGLASILSDPADGTSTVIQGLDSVPGGRAADRRARSTSCTSRGTSWSGSARCSFLLSLWYGAVVAVPAATCRRASCSSGSPRSAGVLSVLAMEAGWVVTEVGRQPWIVLRLHEGRARRRPANSGVWITFLVIVVLYVGVGVTLVLDPARDEPALARAGGEPDETDVPYGPRGPLADVDRPSAGGGAGRELSRRRRGRPVRRRHRLRAVRRRRLRRRVLGPHRRRRRAGRAAARGRSTTRSGRCGRRTTSG